MELEDPAQIFEASLVARLKPMLAATEAFDSPIQKFYEGTTAFVTGGSGFLGKQLLEKLLRATKMSKIFILLRSKKGKPIKQRLEEMLDDPVYDLVKESHPDFASKIIPVEGDVAELKLGLSDENWKTITEEVDIIFHMAATTRFDEALRIATLINVRGTREALALGKECHKLKSFVHVSTAYAHACENFIGNEVLEDFYPSPIQPQTLISTVESVEETKLNEITPSLIKNWPNTYSFAKAVAEEAVRTMSDGLPICIVRPAIVICAEREPKPGWVDLSNIFGASGIIVGPGLGLMRVVYASNAIRIGLIPVDYVNNAIIAAGWETSNKQTQEAAKIYTVTTSTRNRTLWGDLYDTISNAGPDFYSPSIVWRPHAYQTDNTWAFWALSWLLHLIPAYILDGICLAVRKERIFVKLYRKMYKMSLALSYFTVNDWNFVDANTAELYENMSTIDKQIFDFDVHKINWMEYMLIWCIGLRKYVIKDGLKGTYYAKKKAKFFYFLNLIVMAMYFYSMYKVLVIGCYIFLAVFKLFT